MTDEDFELNDPLEFYDQMIGLYGSFILTRSYLENVAEVLKADSRRYSLAGDSNLVEALRGRQERVARLTKQLDDDAADAAGRE
jgi:hypothetical protein